jgi:hypothetical protein
MARKRKLSSAREESSSGPTLPDLDVSNSSSSLTTSPNVNEEDSEIYWAKAVKSKELRRGFRVKDVKAATQTTESRVSKKQKLSNGGQDGVEGKYIQKSPFEDSEVQDVRYRIEPREYWEKARYIRKCTGQSPTPIRLNCSKD